MGKKKTETANVSGYGMPSLMQHLEVCSDTIKELSKVAARMQRAADRITAKHEGCPQEVSDLFVVVRVMMACLTSIAQRSSVVPPHLMRAQVDLWLKESGIQTILDQKVQ